jgi:hypothetical protein
MSLTQGLCSPELRPRLSELQPDHDRVADPIETVISGFGLGMLRSIRSRYEDRIRLAWQPATKSC